MEDDDEVKQFFLLPSQKWLEGIELKMCQEWRVITSTECSPFITVKLSDDQQAWPVYCSSRQAAVLQTGVARISNAKPAPSVIQAKVAWALS